MSKGMNWWRNSRQLGIRHRGAVSLADEYDAYYGRRELFTHQTADKFANTLITSSPAKLGLRTAKP
jgi:hypothetical protein